MDYFKWMNLGHLNNIYQRPLKESYVKYCIVIMFGVHIFKMIESTHSNRYANDII